MPTVVQAIPITSRFSPPFAVLRILVPILNITAQYPVDPDWPAILLFFAPINAVLYGVMGLVIGEVLFFGRGR
jgi:hypothetical protein